MKTCLFFVVVILVLAMIANVQAQIPKTLSYQGILADTLGAPKPDGTYSITFRLYDIASGGTALWTELKTLNVKRGLFSTTLGDQVVLGSNLTFDKQYWLGIQVAAGAELSPRIPLSAVGYSMNSLKADTAAFAKSAPQQSTVDSARIAGTLPNSSVSSVLIADGTITNADIAATAAISASKINRAGFDADMLDGLHASSFLSSSSAASGDLSQYYPNPTVSKIQNRTIANSAPTDGQVLKWNASATQWAPATDVAGGIGGSGTVNYIPKFTTNATTLGASVLFESGGNIGIGTTSVNAPLTFSNSLGGKFSFFGASGSNYGIGVQDYLLQIYSDQSLADIAFGYGSSTNFTETMRIKGNGNVRIGATGTPTAKLDVAGTVKMTGFTLSTGSSLNGKVLTSDAVGLGTWQPAPIGSQWTTSGSFIYYNGGKVGIGASSGYVGKLVIEGAENIGLQVRDITADGIGILTEGSRYGISAEAVGTSSFRSGGLFWVKTSPDQSNYAVVAAVIDGVPYKIYGQGNVSTIMRTRDGNRVLFASESPEPYFEDFGNGALTNGKAHIELDPVFLDCIKTDEAHPMKVFVQLSDDCKGVYVKAGTSGFDVYELQGGVSSASFTFRIVANRKDTGFLRLPAAPPVGYKTTLRNLNSK